eukprot:6192838-Pleurochrysis_carterae.AAC.1
MSAIVNIPNFLQRAMTAQFTKRVSATVCSYLKTVQQVSVGVFFETSDSSVTRSEARMEDNIDLFTQGGGYCLTGAHA